MAWRGDFVQAVIFTQPGAAQPDALKLWSALFKDESPDSFQRPSSGLTAVTTASGQKDGYQLNITSQLGRIALFYQPAGGEQNATEVLTISDFHSACRLAAVRAAALTVDLTTIRAAMLLHLTVPVDAGQEAKTVTNLTGVEFPKDATDCSYQFNVRKPFASASKIPMNRLCTWAPGQHQLISINQTGGESPMIVTSKPFVGLRVDVNSAPGAAIDQKLIEPMFMEMATEALQIADDGMKVFK